jgi:hypothetical protein
MAGPDRPQMKGLRCMRFECCLAKNANTHAEYLTLFAFPRQNKLLIRASALRLYEHCLSCRYVLRHQLRERISDRYGNKNA